MFPLMPRQEHGYHATRRLELIQPLTQSRALPLIDARCLRLASAGLLFSIESRLFDEDGDTLRDKLEQADIGVGEAARDDAGDMQHANKLA